MQLRHPPWFTLLLCLATVSGAKAQSGAQSNALPNEGHAPPTVAPTGTEKAGSGSGSDWRVPPILTSGSISYDLRASQAPGESRLLSQLVTSLLSGRTYLYQPWFATVNGTIGLTVGRSSGGDQEDTSGAPFASQSRASSKDRFLTGSVRVDMFPRSRFPFEVHAERGDSRIDSGLASSLGFRTQTLGFSQRYTPESRAYTLSGSFNRRQQSGSGFRDTQDALTADFGTRWKYNELSLALSHDRARRHETDDRTQFLSVVGRHQYAPFSALSINTTVNATNTKEDVAAPTDLSVLQLSSVGMWHPEGAKLTLSGSVRGLLLRDAKSDQSLESAGATLGATYELNRNARLTAMGGVIFNHSSNSSGTQGFTGSVGASWQGDTLEYRGLRYDWFANGSVSGSAVSGSASDSQTQATIGTQLGHTLSRSWPMTSQSTLVLNAGQTLAASYNQSSESSHVEGSGVPTSSRTLLHAAGATWNVSGDNRSAYARVSYSDSKELGGGNARFQMFNVQVSGTFEFDRNRSLSGDFTYQRSKQRAGDLFETDGRGLVLGERTALRGASGEISYRHQRPFGIPRLRFTSRLKLAQDVLDQPGTFATIPDRETRLWENRLDWLVGRLETQLVLRISQVDGKRREFLMWRLQRNFGE